LMTEVLGLDRERARAWTLGTRAWEIAAATQYNGGHERDGADEYAVLHRGHGHRGELHSRNSFSIAGW
ncbi:hypothetical protein ACWCW2_39515, partial [Streptomyces sp. NPDC001773]